MSHLRPDEIERASPEPESEGPFTREEYERAFRLILSPEEARTVAAAYAGTGHNSRPGERTTFGEELMEDCLVLLSLLSEDLRERVEAMRQRRRADLERLGFEPERLDSRERRWQARRAELEGRVRAEGGLPDGG